MTKKLFEFGCEIGHRFDEWAVDPHPRPCKICGALAKRRFCVPMVIFHDSDPHFSVSLGKPISSRRDFTEGLKALEERRQQELTVVDDPQAWAEYSRIDGISSRGSQLILEEEPAMKRSYIESSQPKNDELYPTPKELETDRRPARELAKEYLRERKR